MSEVETFHDSQADRDSEREEEVVFKEDTPRMESPTPPSVVTANDLDIIIEGWERKFEHLSQCMQEIQLASEKANSNMNNIVRDGRAREKIQERRIEEMHVGLTQHHAVSTHQLRARLSRRLDFVQTSTSNLPSTRLHLQNLRATT